MVPNTNKLKNECTSLHSNAIPNSIITKCLIENEWFSTFSDKVQLRKQSQYVGITSPFALFIKKTRRFFLVF